MGHLILFLIVGLAAGWLAGYMMKGRGFGFGGNLFVGVLGALLGGFLFNLVGLYAYGLVGALIMAVAGSIVLLSVMGRMKKSL